MRVAPFEWRTFAVALLATAAFVALLWTLLPPLYLTNDDVVIRLGIEGTLVPGQPPTGFMLFSHAMLGWLLAWIQPFVALPIWDVVIATLLVVALAVAVALCWSSFPGWLPRTAAMPALAVGAIPLVSGLQFTISATAAGGAAMALAFLEFGQTTMRRSVLVAALLLFVCGELVRPMAGVAGALGLALLVLPIVMSGSEGRRWTLLKRLSVAGATVVLLYGGLRGADRVAYMLSPEWNAYRQYHWTIVGLVDWGGELTPDQIAAMRGPAGWSENDWALLTGWFGVDPDVHGSARVARASAARDAELARIGWGDWLRGRVRLITSVSPIRPLVGSAMVLAAIALLLVTYGRMRGVYVFAVQLLLFAAFCFAVQVVYKELPFRLLAPLDFVLIVAGLLTAAALATNPSPLASVVAASALLTLLVAQHNTVIARMAGGVQQAAEVDRQVQQLRQLDPSLLVLHADAFPSEVFWRPFVRPAPIPPTIRLGDNNQSPALQGFLTSTGRQPLIAAMCEDPSILIVSDAGRLRPATIYLREHFVLNVNWVEAYAGSFRAWRCSPTLPANDSSAATLPTRAASSR